MGVKIKIKQVIFEIEYLLIITLLVSSISKTVMAYLNKYYICLLFVIYHELSHIFVGNIVGKKIRKIFLGISGMTAYFKYEYLEKKRIDYCKECIVYFAGPISNIIMAILFYKSKFIFEINLFLAFLNLLPIYPLDGYNILKSILRIIFVKKSHILTNVTNIISMIFLTLLVISCTIIFLKYKNLFSVIYLLYILIINIRNNGKIP